MKIKITVLAVAVFASLLWQACSTEKNTSVTRFYHNTTARFNVGFNGNESLKEAKNKIENMPDNYTILLPIYKSEKEEAASMVGGDADRAVQKAAKLIDRHSITVRPERKPPKGQLTREEREELEEFYNKPEYNNWVDDAYLIIGKAHYYKHDFRTGMKSLQLVLNKFRKEESRFDAMYWMARSHSAMGNLNDAENYLQLMLEDNNFPKKRLKYDTDLAFVDIYIKRKKYAEAAAKIERLIPETRKRRRRARLKYITAQLYQLTGEDTKALNAFEGVIKMNPPYEMAFSAKINMAKSYSGDDDSEKLEKILAKMLKDDKNIEYQDQIYYALAEIDMKKQDTTSAKQNYLKSTRKNAGNMDQKALSCLSLADIYFAQKDYLRAGAYYDSTMAALDKKHPDYDRISREAGNLSSLVGNIKTVVREDSLQRIALMDSAERIFLIEQVIARVKAEEATRNNADNYRGRDEFSPDNSSQSKGKWYFYNEQALAVGRSEYKKMWGNRKLEDHWRRKNKTIIENTAQTNEDDTTGRVTDNKKIEFYLQDLPLTDSLMAASHERIAQALFAAGLVYERKMNDYKQAELTYEELIKRYPKHGLVVEALFNLYMMNFKTLNNKAKAEQYRQKILKDFPKSKYADILSDPDYMKKLEKTKLKINALYADAYSAYKSENYSLVISKSEEAGRLFERNALAPKFLYLESMARGSSGDVPAMKAGLEDLVKNYPKDDVTPKAQKVLEVIASGKYDKNYYTYSATGDYYYEIILPDEKAKINKVKFLLTSFNVRVFPGKKLSISDTKFDGNQVQVVVQGMSGRAEAEKFYNQLMSENLLSDLRADEYTHFVISKENFAKLQKLQITEKYVQFFVEHYSL